MELGGRPRGQLKEDGIYAHISALYQEFGRYKMTLAQNVYLSDTKEAPDEKRICTALDWAGISFTDHPEEMLLGREFGGAEMSGGQWQRVALVRSYYRDRPILFLDEPTAAIDPLEEMAIYGKLHPVDGAKESFSPYLAGTGQMVPGMLNITGALWGSVLPYIAEFYSIYGPLDFLRIQKNKRLSRGNVLKIRISFDIIKDSDHSV